jgi:hypothetical protein
MVRGASNRACRPGSPSRWRPSRRAWRRAALFLRAASPPAEPAFDDAHFARAPDARQQSEPAAPKATAVKKPPTRRSRHGTRRRLLQVAHGVIDPARPISGRGRDGRCTFPGGARILDRPDHVGRCRGGARPRQDSALPTPSSYHHCVRVARARTAGLCCVSTADGTRGTGATTRSGRGRRRGGW